MELLFGNLRQVFQQRIRGEKRRADHADLTVIIYAAVVAGLSFSLSRVSFFQVMYPCGVALLTVLLARGKWNIYALPLVLLGILSNSGTGHDLKGDLAAAALCGAVFFILNKKRLSMPVRAVIAAVLTMGVKGTYYYMTHLFFLYDGFMVGTESLLILVLVYLFHNILMPVGKEASRKRSAAENLGSMSVLFVLVIAGITPSSVLGIVPVELAALFATLLIAYRMGVMEGAAVGAFSGIAAMLLTASSPAVVGILVCGGLIAGMFKGYSRLAGAVCFAGVCLCFGVVKGYPSLYLSMWEPLIAAAAFAFLPYSLMQRIDLLLTRVRQDDSYCEMAAKNRASDMLKGYHRVFMDLAMTCGRAAKAASVQACASTVEGSGAGGGAAVLSPAGSGDLGWQRRAENSKAIMAYQFKGMAKAVESMISVLNEPKERNAQEPPRFGVRMGISGYAKDDGVSGDSYLCTEFRDNRYMVALSDGMGKGKKAAEESSLTIHTLYNLMQAGFDVDLALKIVNSILLVNSTEEIFSTVDLGLIDLNTGRVKLFKIGAAATFIKRGEKVEAIKVSAPPIGILDRIPVDYVDLRLKKGDELIIVSDGVTDADRGTQNLDWLRETIAGVKSKDPQTMSDLIMNKAIERYGLKEKDDMTVITARIQ